MSSISLPTLIRDAIKKKQCPNSGWVSSALLVSTLAASLGLSAPAFASDPVFTEVSARAGIGHVSAVNGMSGGAAWLDYNSDGWPDILIASQSGANRLYENKKDGTFTSVSQATGLELPNQPTQGIAVADYDGDGLADIFLANGDAGSYDSGDMNTLLRNLGNGIFQDVTMDVFFDTAGLPWSDPNAVIDTNDSFGAAFGDLNGDGYVDLYVSNWGQEGTTSFCVNNEAYINQGPDASGTVTFQRVAASVGIDGNGCSFQSILTDIDNDNDLDIFVVNDIVFGFPPNEVYRNDTPISGGNLVFTPIGNSLNLDNSITGMGIATGDIDSDGDLDYYRTVGGNGPLSVQQGDGTFANLDLDPLPGDSAKNDGTGWGAAFFDADNDGDIDLYRGNDKSGFGNAPDTNYLYLNDGNGGFSSQAFTGLDGRTGGLGLAYADYDKDGDIDILVNGGLGDVQLFRNDALEPGGLPRFLNTRHFVSLNLKGLPPNTSAAGAKVRLSSANGSENRTQMRELQAGSSHGSTHAATVHFGLGDHDSVTNVLVEWADRCSETVANVFLDQETTITQSNCISGVVTTTSGTPAAGVEVLIVGERSSFYGAVYTDTNGFYSQSVPIDGYYITQA